MSLFKETIRKSKGRVNTPLKFGGCNNFPRYHADRFHAYRNCPNKMYPDVAERAKQSIQQCTQHNSSMGGSKGSQGIQYGRCQTFSTKTRYIFAENRARLSQPWNEEGLSSLYQAFLLCDMFNPPTSRSARVKCVENIKTKNDIGN